MNSSLDTVLKTQTALTEVVAHGVLAREAGVPFQLAVKSDAGVDPIAEWLSLMAVVQMLCPFGQCVTNPCRAITGCCGGHLTGRGNLRQNGSPL